MGQISVVPLAAGTYVTPLFSSIKLRFENWFTTPLTYANAC